MAVRRSKRNKDRGGSITLIGMAGVGKSSIGRALARRLSYRFIDTDKRIEKKTGMRLQAYMDAYGRKAFLKKEARAILDLCISERDVISPGGSVVYSARAMRHLKRHSTVVFLDTAYRNIDRWIKNKKTRGIVDPAGGGLRELYRKRRPLYKRYADITVRVTGAYRMRSIVAAILNKR